ncbi:hypothetical protein [Kocuria palustris]|uniref:hypothetical protein n=1 Tax=Kocuria palustris TaxID=71999 RepID=UPI003D717247
MTNKIFYTHFCKNTENHRLRILHDDGLYRHLRMQSDNEKGQPTAIWYWDIITWPGSLAIRGDVADGYIFTRDPDMLEFFSLHPDRYHDDAPKIDMHYWAQKLAHEHRSTATVYDPEVFLASVHDALSNDSMDSEDLMDTARQHMLACLDEQAFARLPDEEDPGYEAALNALLDPIAEEILNDARSSSETESEARQWLHENERLFPEAAAEWDLSDFDPQFKIACWAIDKTVRAYRTYTNENSH